jgi:Na+/H+-dicarboxylate symporter
MKQILYVFLGVVAGILLGLFSPLPLVRALGSIGFVLGEYVKFVIPLLILAFVATGIADFGVNAGRALFFGLALAYVSTILAEILGFAVGSTLLPSLGVAPGSVASDIKFEPFLKVVIPAPISTMGALVLAVIIGLGIAGKKNQTLGTMMSEFRSIILVTINRGVLPVFPLWVCFIFMDVTAKGQLIPTLIAFFKVLVLIIPTQLVFLAFLYTVAFLYTRNNALLMFKNMIPAYFTAMGTMSSAATLPVALECARKAPFLRRETVDFAMPIVGLAHSPGAAAAITMSALVVSILTKGTMPAFWDFVPFMILLGFIEVATVGVPGGSVTAALGILQSVLLFDSSALGLMVALFMIQDTFGTAANVVGDAALTMIIDKAIPGEAPSLVAKPE